MFFIIKMLKCWMHSGQQSSKKNVFLPQEKSFIFGIWDILAIWRDVLRTVLF